MESGFTTAMNRLPVFCIQLFPNKAQNLSNLSTMPGLLKKMIVVLSGAMPKEEKESGFQEGIRKESFRQLASRETGLLKRGG